MAETKLITSIKKPKNVVERNIALLEALMQYFLAKPRIFDSLRDKFELVILPKDDPEMLHYNLELLNAYGSEGKPIVFALFKSSRKTSWKRTRPNLYVPLEV